MTRAAPGDVFRRSTLVAIRAGILLVGALSAWTSRHALNPDAISYLDVSDVYLRGGWPVSQTGYWSPLYPSLMAALRAALGSERSSAAVMAHILNFILFLCAWGTVEWFVREALAGSSAADAQRASDAFVWRVLVYTTFGWATLWGIGLALVTPDMAVAAMAFGAGALCLRVRRAGSGRGSWLALGALLGAGYLTKTAIFPIAVVILATIGASEWRTHRATPRVLLAAAALLAVSLPQIVYVSRLKESPTIGDVGRLAYGWFVARVPTPLWSTTVYPLPAALPSPSGPLQRLPPLIDTGAHPAMYVVNAPLPGTFPLAYDATWWYRHVVVPTDWSAQIRVVTANVIGEVRLLATFLLAGIVMALAGPVSWRMIMASRPDVVLVVSALAALGMYAAVYVEPRYLVPFVLLLIVGLVPPGAQDELSRRVRVGFAVAGTMLCAATLGRTLQLSIGDLRTGEDRNRQPAIVSALRSRGIAPSSRVGYVGDAYYAYWAYFGELRFVAVIPLPEARRFWKADSTERANVIGQMYGAGATAILADAPAAGSPPMGWMPVGPDSSLLLYAAPSSAINDRR